MKIVFISDSDQPSSSGVGDYTLTLCSVLSGLGIESSVERLGPPGSSLRASLVDRVQKSKPDWVSFQFVLYAYANRGLVDINTLPWRNLRGSRGTHVMFHETWIGFQVGASLRERAIGFVQREGIKRAMRLLQPDLVHSSNSLYCIMLAASGIPSMKLPLFGSIPLCKATRDPYKDLLIESFNDAQRASWIVAAFFGQIYPSANLISAVRWLHSKCCRQGKRLMLVSLGNCPTADSTFQALACVSYDGAPPSFHVAGSMPSSVLSPWLSYANCGLATTPYNLIEKSSSAVSFVEHGVPVIVSDPGAAIRGVPHNNPDFAPHYWLFGDKRLDVADPLPQRFAPQPRVEFVARQFIDALRGAESP